MGSEPGDRALELRQKIIDGWPVRELVAFVEKLVVRLVDHGVRRQLSMELGDER